MHLHPSEWLDQSKSVPVGQKRRVYHGAESTRAMDVYNNDDSWSAYCHRCHASGKVYKQFLQRVDTSIPKVLRYWDRYNSITLPELASTHPDKYRAMVVLLHTKGVSTSLLREYKPMYCLTDDRLVFSFDGVHIGRDCTGRSPMKWFKYHQDNSKGFVYLQGKDVLDKRVVICEDLFSCIKITHYVGLSTMCLLGTRFEDEKVTFVIDNNLRVIGCLDGDKGGDDGWRTIRSRCDLLSIPYIKVDTPRGLDPKDLKPQELINLFKEI